MQYAEEASHHLYDSVPLYKEEPLDSTIETSILHKKRLIDLPPEFPPFKVKKQKRPTTSLANPANIFSDMSTPYDISHRMPSNRNRKATPHELDPSEEPTFVNLHPPKGKFWVSEQRIEAQKLQEKLEQLQKEAQEEAKHAESDFDATTIALEKNLEAHQKTLDAFTEQADEDSPERGAILHRIADYYRKLADEIPQIKSDFSQKYAKANEELEKVEHERKTLEEARNASISTIDRQNRTIEGLKQQIRDFQTRCANAEAQLREAMNDKTAMARSSQTNQLKLIEIGKQIVEKRAQQKKLSELVDTLSKDISTRTAELRNATSELQDIEKELEKIRKEITSYRQITEDRTKLCQQLRNTPLRTAQTAGRSQASIQCNRVPKKQPPKKVPGSEAGGQSSSIDGQSQFAQIKSDMTEIQQQMTPQEGGKIEIKSFEDLEKVRETILKNNGIFDYSVNSITQAHGGLFSFDKVNEDESRIFAKWMMRRIMAQAVKSRCVNDASAQTDEVEAIVDTSKVEFNQTPQEENYFEVTDKTPKSLLTFVKNSRFVRLLSSDESDRTPRPFEWMIHTIRSIYDEKTIDDRTAIRDGQPVMRLPEYLLVWAFRQFGKPDLIQKGCWDVFITAHYYMQRFLEVTLFVRFLDEACTTDQLTFFLNCRVWILQRCVSIPIQHEDLNVYFTETYLTPLQVDEFFHMTFKNTEIELIDDLTIRGCACSDPIRTRDNDAANIPMMRVLELAVGEQQDEKVRRLRRMLAFFRPVPRMTLKRFSLFVKNMIPNIDPNMIDSLYRSGLVQNSIRVDMDQEAFTKLFGDNVKIVPQDYVNDEITCEEFAEYSPIYAMALNRWKQFEPFLQRMLNNISPDSYEGAKTIVSEIRHQVFQLLESKVAFDGVLLYQNYHRVLQAVMRACLKLNLPDPSSFVKQVTDFQDILLKKFQTVLVANDTNDDDD
ncbi:hypothetical protein TRFO_40374 [Tritrichomonas foetus]|uniref:Uncharacterized protein n=1 Tax=Tritrichomonas foetus TaxID=1144522 RepID=A0A1J4J6Q9_9EUKA|nr:hypothetical protein TRFO_40374 [Tritrichomonas foetus]|eukprot:OHS93339.1 hypothetical protein TRFO_40374 [Tritrichomonas foetus]